MLILLSVIVVFLLIVVGVLFTLSPGVIEPFVDVNGHPVRESIAEKIWVDINGIPQGLILRGKDRAKPVLLFVHGGPGVPEYFLTGRYPTGLEDQFVVCWWEQRGAGLSYSADISPQTLTANQLIEDLLAVTNYLRDRFGQEKIYLMAHSWGSFLGIQAAQRAPELFQAYIGVSQISYQLKSENLAYAYMLEKFKENGDDKRIKILEDAPVSMVTPLPDAYMAFRDDGMHTLGIGTTHEMKSVITGIFFPQLASRSYTLAEKINFWRGKSFSRINLWDKMIVVDLTGLVTDFKIPIYIFGGKYDYTVNYSLAKAYYTKMTAPLKGFYTFENSAHSPIFEEPQKVIEILQKDVLAGANLLADSDL